MAGRGVGGRCAFDGEPQILPDRIAVVRDAPAAPKHAAEGWRAGIPGRYAAGVMRRLRGGAGKAAAKERDEHNRLAHSVLLSDRQRRYRSMVAFFTKSSRGKLLAR